MAPEGVAQRRPQPSARANCLVKHDGSPPLSLSRLLNLVALPSCMSEEETHLMTLMMQQGPVRLNHNKQGRVGERLPGDEIQSLHGHSS